MLVTPTLEWQDRLSSTYARADKPELSCASSPPLYVGGQPSRQRRRLDKDFTPAPDWRFMHRLDSVSESDDADDAASLIGELSIDENSEVRRGVTHTRHSSPVVVMIGTVPWHYQRPSLVIPNRSHG